MLSVGVASWKKLAPCASLVLLVSCSSASSGPPATSGEIGAIKALYQARLDAIHKHDASAYLATFGSGFTTTNVTGHTTVDGPSQTAKGWSKLTILDSLATAASGENTTFTVLGSHTDGDAVIVSILWREESLRIAENGKPYHFYRDYVSDDRWEQSGGQWVEKSSQLTDDHQIWSFKSIPLSDRKISSSDE